MEIIENQYSSQFDEAKLGYQLLYQNFNTEKLINTELYDSLRIVSKNEEFIIIVRFTDKSCSSCIEELILLIKELDIRNNIKILVSTEYKKELDHLRKIKLKDMSF